MMKLTGSYSGTESKWTGYSGTEGLNQLVRVGQRDYTDLFIN